FARTDHFNLSCAGKANRAELVRSSETVHCGPAQFSGRARHLPPIGPSLNCPLAGLEGLFSSIPSQLWWDAAKRVWPLSKEPCLVLLAPLALAQAIKLGPSCRCDTGNPEESRTTK